MKDAVLHHFQDLEVAIAKREKIEIGIVTDKGTVTATYDPLFKTVSVGGLTVPDKELCFWLQAAYGAKLVSVHSGDQP